MANKNSYVLSIYLYDQGGDSTGKAPVTKVVGVPGKDTPSKDAGDDKKNKITPAKVIMPIAKAGLQMRNDTLNITTGSTQLAKRMELHKTAVTAMMETGINAVTGLATGATLGAALGMSAGGPIGAAAGVALSLIEKLTSIAVKQNQLDAQNIVEAYGNEQARMRLGISFNMSRGRG